MSSSNEGHKRKSGLPPTVPIRAFKVEHHNNNHKTPLSAPLPSRRIVFPKQRKGSVHATRDFVSDVLKQEHNRAGSNTSHHEHHGYMRNGHVVIPSDKSSSHSHGNRPKAHSLSLSEEKEDIANVEEESGRRASFSGRVENHHHRGRHHHRRKSNSLSEGSAERERPHRSPHRRVSVSTRKLEICKDVSILLDKQGSLHGGRVNPLKQFSIEQLLNMSANQIRHILKLYRGTASDINVQQFAVDCIERIYILVAENAIAYSKTELSPIELQRITDKEVFYFLPGTGKDSEAECIQQMVMLILTELDCRDTGVVTNLAFQSYFPRLATKLFDQDVNSVANKSGCACTIL